jgi:ATP-dependent Zn protease
MKKIILGCLGVTLLLSSCVSQKKFADLEAKQQETQDLLKEQMITLLGGYCAEKLVFGDENLTVGSISDLKKTTKIALRMIKDYGMEGNPLLYSTPDFRISEQAICLSR